MRALGERFAREGERESAQARERARVCVCAYVRAGRVTVPARAKPLVKIRNK